MFEASAGRSEFCYLDFKTKYTVNINPGPVIIKYFIISEIYKRLARLHVEPDIEGEWILTHLIYKHDPEEMLHDTSW